ncbi:MAG: DMT family transporter [Cyanobacteria bacterium P01_E01_bin.34]
MALHRSSGRWQLGLGLAALTACLWGMLPLLLDITLQALDPITITWFRFVVAFSVLGTWLGLRGEWPQRRHLTRSLVVQLAIATVFLGANYLAFLVGLDMTSAGTAEVVIQLAPLLLALGGLVVYGEHYTLRQWTGLGVLLAGMAWFLLDTVGVTTIEPQNYWLGSAIVVLAAVLWVVYALLQKQLLSKLSSSQIMLVLYGGCSVMYSFGAQPAALLEQTTVQWMALLACAANTLVAYGAFAESLNHWEASRISAIIALTPILTLVFVDLAAWVWPEQVAVEAMSRWGWTAACIVVCGSWIVVLGRRYSPNQ